ncbi:uncharacterized protein BDR25DRAFT_301179 [Lindgomyces ingoldianus]|uniref:Uncharacterized protein n=1 Tax=Lindgomyces ingoldianus TaxID=673940 RepID=A0ACB6R9Y8_9PLEO|nr:uncharacterized protein BDR25DRAFT_301179 [Lindgomyces ingoldianus]KAF2475555.1 hypothetical protein BDR25DRAFT_301179 [Lindgomyces ingoldianus]
MAISHLLALTLLSFATSAIATPTPQDPGPAPGCLPPYVEGVGSCCWPGDVAFTNTTTGCQLWQCKDATKGYTVPLSACSTCCDTLPNYTGLAKPVSFVCCT